MLPRSVPDSCLFETNPIPEQHSLVWIFSWTDKMLFVFLSGDWSVRRFHTGDHFRGLQWRVSLPSVTSSSSPLSPCSVPPSHSAKVLPLPPCRPVTTMTTRRAESKVRDTRPTVAHSCPAGGPFPPFLFFFFFYHPYECKVPRALHTSQLISMVTAIWQPLETRRAYVCTECSISALEFATWQQQRYKVASMWGS